MPQPNPPCPHCGSERQAVEDPAYLHACPACGGPRLPPGTRIVDGARDRAASAALVRARVKGGSVRWTLRFLGLAAVALTLSTTLSLLGGYISVITMLSMLVMWGAFGLSYRRRHRMRALRSKADLDEAYALAGTSLPAAFAAPADLPVRVAAAEKPAVQVRIDAEKDAEKEALAAAEVEAEKEDAFADFDRRLAAAEKK